MKLETYNTKLIFTAILLFSIFLFSTPVSAAGLIPCGGPTEKMCDICDFLVLIKNIINLILLIFASLATLMVVYIAFLFMFSGGSPARISDAKGKLWLVVIGIFWVLGSWLVLNTILNFVVDKSVFPWPWNQINCTVSKPTLSTPEPLPTPLPAPSASRLSDEDARNILMSNGITINKTISEGTSLEGIQPSAMNGALGLKSGCNCDLVITGGTEAGHKPGIYSHANGYKLDFRPNSALNKYIQDNFRYVGLTNNGERQYRDTAPNGGFYVREKNAKGGDHWDVKFEK